MCRFMVIVTLRHVFEKAMIPPFSKLIIKDSGFNIGHKLFTI